MITDFETDFESANGFIVDQIVEAENTLPNDIVLLSEITIRSKLRYSQSQNYLYVSSSANIRTEYGLAFESTEVEFREEDGVLWLFENFKGGFYTLRLDSVTQSEEYLNLFIYESNLILSEDVIVEKLNNTTFELTVSRDIIEEFESLENLYAGFNFDNFTEYKIKYIFDDNKLVMDFNFNGVKLDGNQLSFNYHLNSVVELVDIVEKLNMEPDAGSCYMMNTSIEDTYIIFDSYTDLKICHKAGENYLAIYLEPGLYSFAGDFEYNMPDLVLNEAGEIIYEVSGTVIDELIQIDEAQIIYIIENHHSTGYPRDLRLEKMYISIEIIEDLPLESGSITTIIESEEDYSYYLFESSDRDKIMFVTLTENTIPIYDNTYVYISAFTGGCNIKNCTMSPFYVPKDEPFKIITRGNRNGTFTFEYFTVDVGELSKDMNSPVDIETYSEDAYAVSSEINGNIYISFTVTETDNYLVVNDNIISNDDYLEMNLYDSDGNLLTERWQTYLELEPGIYTVEFHASRKNVVFVPSLIVYESE